MEAGVGAAHRQLMRYQDQGDDTLIKILRRWAPSSDGNDTAGYINAVSSSTGFEPDQKLDMRDPTTAGKVIRAMAEREDGRRYAPDMATINAGIADNLRGNVMGPYSGQVMPSGGGGGGGIVKVEIVNRNAPPGTSMTTTTSGNVQASAKVETTGILAPR
jgi:hypothetical protein